MSFQTEQEDFWHGQFGSAYTERNQGVQSNLSALHFWSSVLRRTGPLGSAFELGCNRGINLDAIKILLPDCHTSGLEINTDAASIAESNGHNVFKGSILAPPPLPASNGIAELAFISGVLIHIQPDQLPCAYDLLYTISKKYILLSEYFNPTPVEVDYRGHEDRLFKRDFASELWDRFPDLSLIDYGFVWRRDPLAAKDDTTWFLFEKICQ